MAASKNNPEARKKGGKVRMLGDSKVVPVRYKGCSIGHGTYMAGRVGNDLVRDANNKPVPLKLIGQMR